MKINTTSIGRERARERRRQRQREFTILGGVPLQNEMQPTIFWEENDNCRLNGKTVDPYDKIDRSSPQLMELCCQQPPQTKKNKKKKKMSGKKQMLQ